MFTLNSSYKKFVLALLLSVSTSAFSSSTEELQGIYNSAKAQYVQPETLDQLMIKLRPYFDAPNKETDSLFMATLDAITAAYVMNNHFKQGYQVYSRYVRFQEMHLKKDLDDAVNAANAAVNARREREDAELATLQNNVKELESDIAGYKSKRAGFKTYFSIAIIVLSTIIAAMLVTTGVKLNNLRMRLKQNRDRMKQIHRKAVIGNFSKGLIDSIRNNLALAKKSL